ncbi:MAG: asparagine synthase (glutamine-hydrolyzing), partial [Acidobacteriaceae bacterium]|nr:asparagine synthase (glutamine-hydrolyzing) [Acidobacteriaceae bacterium]
FVGLSPVRNGAGVAPAAPWRSFEHRRRAESYQVGLGSRRLSILDLSEAGHMPMNLRGTDLWVTFNGEIYNYVELRSELTEREFATGTDTEVLLAAYEKWGTNCLSRLNGMFAFALWDGRRKKLFLARDRFGEKPLYYTHSNGRFMFGSELKQFLEDRNFSREVDRSAFADFLLLSVQDHNERTFLADAKQLPAAHYFELDVVSGRLSEPTRYWMPEVGDDMDTSNDADFEERLRFLLKDSIRMRLRSDVPVGVCLSGGLDSSTICSLAAPQLENPSALAAYTITFPGFPEDETALAVQCASRTGVRHVKSTFSAATLWNEMRDFAYFQDGPAGGPAIFASWRVFKMAHADGAAVLLNGQGGDELLGGYNKFFFFWFQILASRGAWLRLMNGASTYLRGNGFRNFRFSTGRKYFPRALQKNVMGMWQFSLPDLRLENSTKEQMGSGNSFNQRLWLDLSRFSLPSILHWEDRNSMAVSTEARLPFLDHRIAEATLKTSTATKLKNGFAKYALRHAMRDTLPPAVCWSREKKGFSTPGRDWFAVDLVPMMRDMLSQSDSPLSGFLDMAAIRKHYEVYVQSNRNGNTLSHYDWFKIMGAHNWMEQLKTFPTTAPVTECVPV